MITKAVLVGDLNIKGLGIGELNHLNDLVITYHLQILQKVSDNLGTCFLKVQIVFKKKSKSQVHVIKT